MRRVIHGEDSASRRRNACVVRAVFVLYLTLIVAGIAFYAVIGLAHN
jgi:hypothetical protein